MSKAIRNILGLFTPVRRMRDETIASHDGAVPDDLAGDLDHADIELQKRHDEIAGRIRGLGEILEHLSARGPLSDWLEPPLAATFQHHRATARENITLQHAVDTMRRQAENNAGEAAELLKQLQAASELARQKEAELDLLRSQQQQMTLAVSDNLEALAEELAYKLEQAEESARQWYDYAQALEAELTDTQRSLHHSTREVATLEAELIAERQNRNMKNEGATQQLLDQNRESIAGYQKALQHERRKSEEFAVEVEHLQQQGRVLRKKLDMMTVRPHSMSMS